MTFKIDLKIFFFLIIFYLTEQISLYLWMMLFAVIHELGHLLAGVLLGMRSENIMLTPIGFSIKFKVMEDDYNQKVLQSTKAEIKKIIVALAGPITNIILIILCLILNVKVLTKDLIVNANILIALFNLLPIYPLDGGRILKSLLNLCVGRKNAYIYIQVISKFFMLLLTLAGSVLIYYLKNIAIFLIIIYLWGIVIRESKVARIKTRMYELIAKQK